MTKTNIRITVSLIIIFGHLLVFIIGFFLLNVLGPLEINDAIQLILMSTPILSIVSIQAMKYIMTDEIETLDNKKVSLSFSIVSIIFPSIFIFSIILIFLFTYFQIDGFSVSNMKLSLGIIETFLGIYLGMITDKLFNICP